MVTCCDTMFLAAMLTTVNSVTLSVIGCHGYRFGPTLKTCLCQICGYRQLIAETESVRKTLYSSENREHEKLLMQVRLSEGARVFTSE